MNNAITEFQYVYNASLNVKPSLSMDTLCKFAINVLPRVTALKFVKNGEDSILFKNDDVRIVLTYLNGNITVGFIENRFSNSSQIRFVNADYNEAIASLRTKLRAYTPVLKSKLKGTC